MIPSPAKTYKTISLQTASQVELVIRMYEGAIRFWKRPKSEFDYEDPIERISRLFIIMFYALRKSSMN